MRPKLQQFNKKKKKFKRLKIKINLMFLFVCLKKPGIVNLENEQRPS